MKTCLFSACYLDGKDDRGSSRFFRTQKYLEYYWPLRDELGFQNIVLYDNASALPALIHLIESSPPLTVLNSPPCERLPISVFSDEYHLAKYSTFHDGDPRRQYDYPYCWRALWFVRELLSTYGFDKVICIDTDGFVLSPRLAHAIRDNHENAWSSLWCPKYDFPETAVQIIGPKHEMFMDVTKTDWRNWNGLKMEDALPVTILEGFNSDRYGEDRKLVTPDIDFYGQAPYDMEMKYRWGK